MLLLLLLLLLSSMLSRDRAADLKKGDRDHVEEYVLKCDDNIPTARVVGVCV